MRTLVTTLILLAGSSTAQDLSTLLKKAGQLYDARKYRDALPLHREAAQAGDAHAMTRVGYCYHMGYGATTRRQ